MKNDAEERLHAAEASLEQVTENVPGALFRYILRPDGTDGVAYISRGCTEVWELSAESIRGDPTALWNMIDAEDLPGMQASIMASARNLDPWSYEWRITTPSGRRKWLRGVGRPYRNADGAVVWNSFILDITEARDALDALRTSERRLAQVMSVTGEGLWDWDIPRNRVTHNQRWCQLLRVDDSDLEHPFARLLPLLHPEDRAAVQRIIDACLAGERSYASEHRMVRGDGTVIWVEDRGDVVERAPDGRPLRMLGSLSDITARKAAEAEAARLAFFDALTGLPNRRLLADRIGQAVALARRDGNWGAVLFVDLDDFKTVNDSRGHGAGDALLVQVARRLEQELRVADTLARLGGDEFVVLVTGLAEKPDDALVASRNLAEKLLRVLLPPFTVEGDAFEVTASVGVTMLGPDALTPDDLVREADTAMYKAKAAGRNQVAFFATPMHEEVRRRVALDAELRRALTDGQFELHVQSQVAADGATCGAELLIRWNHPQRGLVPPGEFIPAAEASGFITRIGDWILEEACRLAGVLTALGRPVPLSVNVSPRQFRQADFVARVAGALERHRVPPGRLVFEITEGLFLDHLESTVERMRQLVDLGATFSVDDFGTGYSSLGYLKTLPIAEIKIDRRFVQGIPDDTDDVAIVRAILALADHMQLRVVAEGVERDTQAAFLVAHGCHCLQGFLFDRPAPVEAWLSRWS